MIRIYSLILAFTATLSVLAADGVRFYDEASDTTRLNSLLQEASTHKFNTPEDAVAFFGLQFVGTLYVAHTLENDSVEMLTVNLEQLDCTTFAETALALASTAMKGQTSWSDYADNLRSLRYRNAEVDGYASRLHYIADWAIYNHRRGNMYDATTTFPRHTTMTRTIDYMSGHRDAYPSLKDSVQYARIQAIEQNYHNHKFPYIANADLDAEETVRAFHSGDVVAMVSTRNDLDVTHLGMVIKDSDGTPHLLHASYSNKKVELTSQPFADFIRANKYWIGVRVFRLQNH